MDKEAKFDDGCGKKPFSVFNTLAKIRAASYRIGFNVWDLFKSLDPYKNKVVSVSKFVSVLGGPMKNMIGLSDEEITDVTQYFRQADGRVMYDQFCNMVHGGEDDDCKAKEKTEEAVTSNHRNQLVAEEEKYLLMMLTKIAVLVNRKRMLLRPFFQDYALVRKGSGLVSRSRLARVLDQVGVHLSSRDYNLLLRKYSKDSLTVSYLAFLEDLEIVRRYLEDNDSLDEGGDLLPKFAGRLQGWNLPELPRPEIVEANEQSVGLGALDKFRIPQNEVLAAMDKIRSHLFREKFLIAPLFQMYDSASSGRVTQAQFRLVLTDMSRTISGVNFLRLTPDESYYLGRLYADPVDNERILWKAFDRDVYTDLSKSDLEKWPEEREKLISQVAEKRLRERNRLTWAQTDHPAPPPTSLQQVLVSIKRRLIQRNINLKPTFLKYDSEGVGLINRSNLRKAMIYNCILCTELEYELMEEQYFKGGFFNYTDLLSDLDKTVIHTDIEDSKNNQGSNNFIEKLENERRNKEGTRKNDIIEVLAKIKCKLICAKLRTKDYLKALDEHNTGVISENDFRRILETIQLDISNTEIDTVLSVFRNSSGLIEYRKFCNTVDEESERPCLTRLPLKEAMVKKDLRSVEFKHPFLNYEERRISSVVAKKLCNKLSLGQLDQFKTIDKSKTGLISKTQLMAQLHSLGLLHTITMNELDTIIKAFGVIPDGETSYSLDYLAFLNALDIVEKKLKAANNS